MRVNKFQLPLFSVSTERETRFELLQSVDAKRIVPGLEAGIGPAIQDLLTGFFLDDFLVIGIVPDEWHPSTAAKRVHDGGKNKAHRESRC